MEADRRHRQFSVAADLIRGAGEFGIHLSDEQIAAFDVYVDTLLLWSSRLSLTTARSPREITTDHILDSLSLVPWLAAGATVADLGSGAGFPGVPIAIARPDTRMMLLEARRKRANFLREVVRRCRLTNAIVWEERAEKFAANNSQKVDVTVSRAVWPLRKFLTISRLFLRSGGLAIAMKGPKAKAAVAPEPGFLDPEVVTYRLAGGAEHILVICRRQ